VRINDHHYKIKFTIYNKEKFGAASPYKWRRDFSDVMYHL